MNDFLMIVGGLAIGYMTRDVWRLALARFISTKLATQQIREAVELERMPVLEHRRAEIEESIHREQLAMQEARTTYAEANLEILRAKAAKAVEEGEGLLILPTATPPPRTYSGPYNGHQSQRPGYPVSRDYEQLQTILPNELKRIMGAE
jgi:hypothetical protein